VSDLGEISAEVREALDRLDRVLAHFGHLDRGRLAPIQSQLGRSPAERQAVALVARARVLLREAAEGAQAARSSGADWLDQHGSADSGRSGGGSSEVRSSSPSFVSPGAESAWTTGFATPGGKAYYPPAEPGLREAAATLPEFSGEYTFDAHGDSGHVFVGGQALSAAAVVELIEADPNWGRRPIRLFSCNTGRGEDPIAAGVATGTGVKVTAPDGYAWSLAGSGEFGVYPVGVKVVNGEVVEGPDRSREGSWREFEPG
jgi:hypothetical protein